MFSVQQGWPQQEHVPTNTDFFHLQGGRAQCGCLSFKAGCWLGNWGSRSTFTLVHFYFLILGLTAILSGVNVIQSCLLNVPAPKIVCCSLLVIYMILAKWFDTVHTFYQKHQLIVVHNDSVFFWGLKPDIIMEEAASGPERRQAGAPQPSARAGRRSAPGVCCWSHFGGSSSSSWRICAGDRRSAGARKGYTTICEDKINALDLSGAVILMWNSVIKVKLTGRSSWATAGHRQARQCESYHSRIQGGSTQQWPRSSADGHPSNFQTTLLCRSLRFWRQLLRLPPTISPTHLCTTHPGPPEQSLKPSWRRGPSEV